MSLELNKKDYEFMISFLSENEFRIDKKDQHTLDIIKLKLLNNKFKIQHNES